MTLSKLKVDNLGLFRKSRDIAQLGRAPALGAGGRRFKSYYPESSYFQFKFKRDFDFLKY